MGAVVIRAAGLVTPVGLSGRASCAALRARIRNVNVTNLWDPESGQYIAAGRVPLPQWWEGPGMFPELIAPAIAECLGAAAPATASDVALLLGLPHPSRPSIAPEVYDSIIPAIERKLSERFHAHSRVIPNGNVAGVVALQHAQGVLDDPSVACCIVAGVDSLLQQSIVLAYMKRRRVLTPANSNGFSPGEAGAAVLVARAGTAERGDLQVLGLGLAAESATIESDRPLRGNGLAEAIRRALTAANLKMSETSYRLTDLNGEHYKFKEAALAFNRLLRARVEAHPLWHPIEYIGEVGAAIGPLTFAVALDAGRKQYAPGPIALCHFSDDHGGRGAAVLGFTPA
jgi:3-oxoacyl-[acyl-carrier-protein] synthase-1